MGCDRALRSVETIVNNKLCLCVSKEKSLGLEGLGGVMVEATTFLFIGSLKR